MDWIEQTLLLVIALVANIFSAFAGGGAGLLQFPALIFLGLPFGVALATHKVASVALGVGATLRHLREKSLERRFALFILAAGLPGVVVGAAFILRVPDRLAQVSLGVLTIGLGVYSYFNKQLGLKHEPKNRHARGYVLGGPGAPVLDKRDRTSKSLSRSRARRVDLLRRPRPPCGRAARASGARETLAYNGSTPREARLPRTTRLRFALPGAQRWCCFSSVC